MGEDENFWPANAPSQGPDGVCGPCSEIYFHTPFGEVEIWNLVFTQFNRVGEPPNNLRPCRARTSTRAWAWSARPRCCRASSRTSTSTSSVPWSKRPARCAAWLIDPAERKRPPPAPHCRPRPRLHVCHPRKRLSRQQEAGLRDPPAVAPGRARRPSDGRPRAVPAQARRPRGRVDEETLSRTGRNRRHRRRRDREGGSQLPRHHRRRARVASSGFSTR